MKPDRIWIPILFFVLLLTFYQEASAAELKGKVASVNGFAVQVQLEEALIPQVGDPVTIGFAVPGTGVVPLEGRWQVSFVGAETIEAEPVGAVAPLKISSTHMIFHFTASVGRAILPI